MTIEPARSAPAEPARRVLIVDDDADTRRLLTFVLERWKFKVASVATARAAVDAASAQKFDALICDLHLPDGNGLRLSRQLPTPIPTFIVSGRDVATEEPAELDGNIQACFLKPVDFDALHAALSRLPGFGSFGR